MKKYISLALAVIMIFALCGCGAQKTAEYAPVPMPEEAMYAAADSYAASNEGVAGKGLASYSTGSRMGGVQNDAGGDVSEKQPDKIIYSADATVETVDFDGTLDKLNQLIDKYGAWVESSSVSGSNYSDISRGRASLRSASYTLRIPSESFDTLMGSLTDLGNVPYTHIYTDNITAQYYDTQARLDAYKTQEQSLLKLMEKAESVEDIITIENKLSEVRYNIERLQSTLNNWDRQVSYSTVYLGIEEVAEYTPAVVVNPGFGERIATAFTDGISGAIEFLGDALVWLIEALPALILLAVVIVVLFFSGKKLRAKRRAKKAAKAEAKEEKK